MFQVSNFTHFNEAAQFCHAVARNVFVNVVVALRAQTLQGNVAVKSGQTAKAFAVEGVVGVRSFVLHDVFHHFEAMKVSFIKVGSFGLGDFFLRGGSFDLSEIRVGYAIDRGTQNAEEQEHIDEREQEHVDREEYQTEAHGDYHKQYAHQT